MELPGLYVYLTLIRLKAPMYLGGPVLIKTKETSRWRGVPRKPELRDWDELSVIHKYNENSRGLGLSDMAYAIRDRRPNRASGEMAYHVLEIGYALLESAKNMQYYHLSSTCDRPDPLPVDFSL